jgi:hypothetical protein
MSTLERPYRSIYDLRDAILENDGNALEALLFDNVDALVSAVLSTRSAHEKGCLINDLEERLATEMAARLWSEQSHIFVASESELKEMAMV